MNLKKILKIHKIKYRVSKKKFITKYFKVNLTKNKIIGQKEKEELFNKSEIKKITKLDNSTILIKTKLDKAKIKFLKNFKAKLSKKNKNSKIR